MELEEDGGYCTLSPSAEVMLQGGKGGRGTLSKVKSLGREGLHWSELVKLFFFKIYPWNKMQEIVIYFNWCIWLWAGTHELGDHSRDQDTQQSLNCKLKNKKSIITVPGCSWLETANSLQNMIIFIGGIYNTAMTQSFYGLQILLLLSVFWLVK